MRPAVIVCRMNQQVAVPNQTRPQIPKKSTDRKGMYSETNVVPRALNPSFTMTCQEHPTEHINQ